MVTVASDRRSAATQLYRLILSRREQGETLPNVGAVLEATIDSTAVSRPAALASGSRGHQAPRRRSLARDTSEAGRSSGARSTSSACWAVALFWWPRGLPGDYLLLSATHLLTALAFAALVSRQDPLRDTMLFVRHAQLTSVGLLVFALVSAIDYRRVARAGLSYLPLAGALALSVLFILFGGGPSGSGAKVNLGPLQPIEFIRLLLALFLAGYFARRWELLRAGSRPARPGVQVPRWLNVPRADYVLPVVAGVAAALLFFFCRRISDPRSSCRASS